MPHSSGKNSLVANIHRRKVQGTSRSKKKSTISKKAYAENISLKKAAALLGYLSEEKFDAYVQPTKMTAPGFRGDEGGY
mgnify:CR=1 FL=1